MHIYVVNEEQEKNAEQALESPIRSHGCSTRTSTVHRSKSRIVRMPYRERKKKYLQFDVVSHPPIGVISSESERFSTTV